MTYGDPGTGRVVLSEVEAQYKYEYHGEVVYPGNSSPVTVRGHLYSTNLTKVLGGMGSLHKVPHYRWKSCRVCLVVGGKSQTVYYVGPPATSASTAPPAGITKFPKYKLVKV